MKTILTKKDQIILVDDADYEIVRDFTWHVSVWGYAETNIKDPTDGVSRTARMHRMLFGLKRGDKRHVDHINGDKLDNRRSVNLRVCTRSENMCNMGQNRSSKSGLKGVSLHKASGLWIASVSHNRKNIHYSYHKTKEAAHAKYCEIASKAHGSFFNPGVPTIKIGVE